MRDIQPGSWTFESTTSVDHTTVFGLTPCFCISTANSWLRWCAALVERSWITACSESVSKTATVQAGQLGKWTPRAISPIGARLMCDASWSTEDGPFSYSSILGHQEKWLHFIARAT